MQESVYDKLAHASIEPQPPVVASPPAVPTTSAPPRMTPQEQLAQLAMQLPDDYANQIIQQIAQWSLSGGMSHPEPQHLHVRTARREEARPTEAEPQLNTNEHLFKIFKYFCAYGRTGAKGLFEDTLDNVNFDKFCRMSKLVGKNVTRTDIDLIFTKAKPKSSRRLDYEHFLDALSAIAAKKFPKKDPATAFSLFPQTASVERPKSSTLPQRKTWRDMYQYGDEAVVAVEPPPVPGMPGMSPLKPRKSPVKKPTQAGEANRPNSVYSRLADPKSFTGVYRRNQGKGGINHFSDLGTGHGSEAFEGDTNTGTDATIHDISETLRPAFRGGTRYMKF